MIRLKLKIAHVRFYLAWRLFRNYSEEFCVRLCFVFQSVDINVDVFRKWPKVHQLRYLPTLMGRLKEIKVEMVVISGDVAVLEDAVVL